MRRLRLVSASILKARFSLSEVSSSIELEAVFTSTPSLRSRSITSWLESPRSRASWKTLTLTIRPSSLSRVAARLGARRDRLVLAFALGLGGRLGRLLLGCLLLLRQPPLLFGRGRRFRRGGLLGGLP